MPELPEVETVRRGLAPVFEAARIVRLEQRRADLRFAFPDRFAERLAGRRTLRLARRAKYLVGHLDDGAALIMHLGMSGSFRIEDDGASRTPGAFAMPRGKAAAHDHVVFHFEDGRRVIYNDPRRFGFMLLAEPGGLEAHPFLAGLGPEPTGNGLDPEALATAFRGRQAPVKALLLDQRVVAGLGNIYVCEALHRVGLSPETPGAAVAGDAPLMAGLAAAIGGVIAEAIEAGGSSLRDHRQADGSLGYFQHAFAVYGREGETCPRPGCGGHVSRLVQSGRSTFYCPHCQPMR